MKRIAVLTILICATSGFAQDRITNRQSKAEVLTTRRGDIRINSGDTGAIIIQSATKNPVEAFSEQPGQTTAKSTTSQRTSRITVDAANGINLSAGNGKVTLAPNTVLQFADGSMLGSATGAAPAPTNALSTSGAVTIASDTDTTGVESIDLLNGGNLAATVKNGNLGLNGKINPTANLHFGRRSGKETVMHIDTVPNPANAANGRINEPPFSLILDNLYFDNAPTNSPHYRRYDNVMALGYNIAPNGKVVNGEHQFYTALESRYTPGYDGQAQLEYYHSFTPANLPATGGTVRPMGITIKLDSSYTHTNLTQDYLHIGGRGAGGGGTQFRFFLGENNGQSRLEIDNDSYINIIGDNVRLRQNGIDLIGFRNGEPKLFASGGGSDVGARFFEGTSVSQQFVNLTFGGSPSQDAQFPGYFGRTMRVGPNGWQFQRSDGNYITLDTLAHNPSSQLTINVAGTAAVVRSSSNSLPDASDPLSVLQLRRAGNGYDGVIDFRIGRWRDYFGYGSTQGEVWLTDNGGASDNQSDTRMMKLRSDRHLNLAVATLAPPDEFLDGNSIVFWLNEADNTLNVRVRRGDGTYRNGTITLQ